MANRQTTGADVADPAPGSDPPAPPDLATAQPSAEPAAGEASVRVSTRGQQVVVEGSGFTAGEQVAVVLVFADHDDAAPPLTVGPDGSFAFYGRSTSGEEFRAEVRRPAGGGTVAAS